MGRGIIRHAKYKALSTSISNSYGQDTSSKYKRRRAKRADDPYSDIPEGPALSPIYSRMITYNFTRNDDISTDTLTKKEGTGGGIELLNRSGGGARVTSGEDSTDPTYYETKTNIVELTTGKDVWIKTELRMNDLSETGQNIIFGLRQIQDAGVFSEDSDASIGVVIRPNLTGDFCPYLYINGYVIANYGELHPSKVSEDTSQISFDDGQFHKVELHIESYANGDFGINLFVDDRLQQYCTTDNDYNTDYFDDTYSGDAPIGQAMALGFGISTVDTEETFDIGTILIVIDE